VSLRVAGLMRGGGRERLAVMDIAAAQLALARMGLISRIDISSRPGAIDADALQARLQSELPPGLIGRASAKRLQRMPAVALLPGHLNVLALVALFTGGFLVFSAQALSLVRRRAQLARCVCSA